MTPIRYITAYIALPLAASFILLSCGNNTGKEKTATAASSSVAPGNGAWKDPRKGKIWSKVNVVQIPLTAYENHILGKVKTVSYRNYEYVEAPKNAKQLLDSGYNVYNEAGQLTEQHEYNADGSKKWECIYKYDGRNKATEWDFQFFAQKEHTKTHFKYDDKGNQVEAATTNDLGKVTDRETITYDDKGNDLTHTAYDASGQVVRTDMFNYDNKGNQVELIQKFTGKIPTRRMTVAYDANGNQAGGASYRDDTVTLVKWSAKNDAYGRCIERTSSKPDGTILGRVAIKYDQWNNETEYLTYNADGTLNEDSSYFYENTYDGKGNIIHQTTYKIKDGVRKAVDYTENTFTYY